MSVHAGTIVTVGGANVIDRLQSAGLGNVTLPVEAIREVGNELVVDKIPGEADFTFSMESYNVSTEMMAFLTGKTGAPGVRLGPGRLRPGGHQVPLGELPGRQHRLAVEGRLHRLGGRGRGRAHHPGLLPDVADLPLRRHRLRDAVGRSRRRLLLLRPGGAGRGVLHGGRHHLHHR
jgi:hypothetical protein